MGINLEKYSKNEACPVRNILDRLGDKWSMLVILVLHDRGVLRFTEIHKTIGDISQKMLTVTLKTLEADGLVSRKVYPEIPPRVEYQLTELGEDLVPHLVNLTQWAEKNWKVIMASRKGYKR